MTYSPRLSSGFTFARNRSAFLSPQSGMCSFCTEACPGTCEIAQAAVLGARTVYPTTTGSNQIASEKDYPIDFSHFNINGRVFGARGAAPTPQEATIFNVGLEQTYGFNHPVKLALPFILPALIKLNWQDYFSGAAMAGVTCFIGEGAIHNDRQAVFKDGKVIESPLIKEALECFERYNRGYGQIVLQSNLEDDLMGVPELAIQKYGAEAIEIKFGQGAKGTQPAVLLQGYQDALRKQTMGFVVHPDPSQPGMKEKYEKGVCPNFYSYGRLPQWTETSLSERIYALRKMGAKNIYFKMAGYDPDDIERVLRIACAERIDMVTFDGAGGGSGYSPSKMMNEWCLPTICLEDAVVRISETLKAEGLILPALAITGGFASEDQAFKALAYGNGHIHAVGYCRAAMAAAMTGKTVGEQITSGQIPSLFEKHGASVEEIFTDLADLRALYGREANHFPTGAVGVFSYLNKLAFGVRHFGALNRKFNLHLFSQEDLIPLTSDARDLLNNRWFL